MRLAAITVIAVLSLTTSIAADRADDIYVMNFDLIVSRVDTGDVHATMQLQGIHLQAGQPFHGEGFGEMDYFFTVSEMKDGKGKLTIEFYQYETHRKKSDVISELVEEVDFSFGSPSTFESMNDEFAVNLAFSVVEK